MRLLGDAAGDGKGRIEDGDTEPPRPIEVDLVRTDAETTNRFESLGSVEGCCVDLRARTDADVVDRRNRFEKIVAGERVRQSFDTGVTGGGKALDRGFVNALEEQDAYLFVGHGRILRPT